jgi:hypothetical protein
MRRLKLDRSIITQRLPALPISNGGWRYLFSN